MGSEMTLDKRQKVTDFAISLAAFCEEPQTDICDEHYDEFMVFLGDNPDLDYDTYLPIFRDAYLRACTGSIPDNNSDK